MGAAVWEAEVGTFVLQRDVDALTALLPFKVSVVSGSHSYSNRQTSSQ